LLWVARMEPVAQPLSYHDFADQRSILGIRHFWNVVSNPPLRRDRTDWLHMAAWSWTEVERARHQRGTSRVLRPLRRRGPYGARLRLLRRSSDQRHPDVGSSGLEPHADSRG
jgi:hypothetical protein